MAKVVICERCGAMKALVLGCITPPGWLEVQEHASGPNPPQVQLCGVRCLELWAAGRVLAETAQPALQLVDGSEAEPGDGSNGVH